RPPLGERDLVPVVVLLAPERRAPDLVHHVERFVALQQPPLEGVAAAVAVAAPAELVVDLPRDHALVGAEALCERADDPSGRLAERRPVRTVVTPLPKRLRATVGAHRQDLRMAGDEPRGRRRGRSAEDDLEPFGCEHADRLVEPGELELARARLEARPRELTEAHHPEPGLRHQLRVDTPTLARPLLGVVRGAEPELRRHPLTVPAMIPATRRRWKNRNPTSSGSVLTTDPAIRTS